MMTYYAIHKSMSIEHISQNFDITSQGLSEQILYSSWNPTFSFSLSLHETSCITTCHATLKQVLKTIQYTLYYLFINFLIVCSVRPSTGNLEDHVTPIIAVYKYHIFGNFDHYCNDEVPDCFGSSCNSPKCCPRGVLQRQQTLSPQGFHQVRWTTFFGIQQCHK